MLLHRRCLLVLASFVVSVVGAGALRATPVTADGIDLAPYDLHVGVASKGKAGAVRADNPAQGLAASIGGEGVTVGAIAATADARKAATSAADAPGTGGWSVSFALHSIGRGDHLAAVAAADVVANGRRAELHRGSLVEWYDNRPDGLEQGFDLAARPAGKAGEVVLELAVETDGLVAVLAEDAKAVSFLLPGAPFPVLRYAGLVVTDAHGRDLPATMELASRGDTQVLRLRFDDRGARYPVCVDPLLTSSSWSSSESGGTFGVAWGDWDGDGDLDLAAGNFEQPNRVYENIGGTLATTAVWSSAESDRTLTVAWGDWDGDGDLDLAAGNHTQPIRVYENSGGTLSTSATWSSAASDQTTSVAWGDWDGDGDLDLAAGNYTPYPTRVYENSGGTLATTATWSSAASEQTTSVAWGDWNGDGDLDLAVGNLTQPKRVYENTGGTLGTSAIWSSTESDSTYSVAWGDWDGDGDLDLAAGNVFNPDRVYLNGGGTLSNSAVWSSATTDNTDSVAWGDWDGDGDLDLAAANNGGQPIRVYQNAGGTLPTTATWTSTESFFANDVAWGDWDGDGDLELAVGTSGASSVRVYVNTATPLATSPVWSSTDTDNAQALAFGDWDGDGDLDLAIANAEQPTRVYVNDAGVLDATASWASSAADSTLDVAWGDWDGDGDLDLAVANFTQPSRVYENTGGTLSGSAAWSSSEAGQAYSVAWGDWDGDGDLDLALGNHGQPNRVYENTGGTLSSSAVWSSSESDDTVSIAWGDWDGDGDLDLAAGNEDQPNRVYLNTAGALSSSAVWSSSESDTTEAIAWGDWDGDGDLDLAAGNLGQPNRVYVNSGTSLDTTAAWSSTESDDTFGVAWGDWDGDGDLDLAAANDPAGIDPAPLRVYANVGGTLATTATWTLSVTDRTWSVAWGDVDADGDLDLAAATFGGPSRLYRNGTLMRPMRLPETPVSPVIARRPGLTGAAAAYSSECLTSTSVVLDFSLVDEEGDPARRVVLERSLDGASWSPATVASGYGTSDLAASATGAPHQLVWDNLADDVLHAPLVYLRLTVPSQASMHVAGPIQRAAMRAVSPPFSLCVPAADLTVTLDDGATTETPGTAIAYTLTVANAGPDDAAGVTVSDDFPAQLTGVAWTCAGSGGGVCPGAGSGDIATSVDLPAGGSVTFSITATVAPSATGTLTNTATAALPGMLHELTTDDNSASDVDVLVQSTDLAISNDDGQSSATAGDPISYTVVVTNAGPSDAFEAQVVDLFPAALLGVEWSCQATGGATCAAGGTGNVQQSVDLPVGSSVTFTVDATISTSATGALTTTATVFPSLPLAQPNQLEVPPANGSSLDPDLTNNVATDVDTLLPAPQSIFGDGFESGTTASWAASSP